MKMRILFTVLLLMRLVASAQTFTVDTLFKNGSIADRINLVFLGDGYTAAEQTKFISDVNEIIDAMFADTPFKQYKPYFNAFAVKVISQESGADHPQNSTDGDGACLSQPFKEVNNYFGSKFDFAGIHRLLYPVNSTAVASVLAVNFPLYDQAFIVVNSPYYGGAGGSFATCSDHEAGREVAIHEIGHSFAGLADEYWAGAVYATEKPNMTQETSALNVKWKNWMGVSGVGIYSHAVDPTWKKPHQNCKMGILNYPFCKVCSETFVERFHLFVTPLSGYTPEDRRFNVDPQVGQNFEFSVSVVPPDPNTLKITWELDGAIRAKNNETFSVSSTALTQSTTVRATVTDTTELTRSESHVANHVYVVEWQLLVGEVVTGTEIETHAKRYDLSVYPNPLESTITFSYALSHGSAVNVSLMDQSGRAIKTLVNEYQPNGSHTYAFDRHDLSLQPGAYILQFKFGNTEIPMKVIVR